MSSGRLPDDRPPPDLARLIPSLDPPGDPECFERPEVRAYLREREGAALRELARARRARARRSTVLRFSLDRGGTVVGACVKQSDDAAVGASVVRALSESPRFPPMPDRVVCLARHPLLGTFGVEPH